jgi:hypothetical protein
VTHSAPAKHEHAVALNKIREWLASPEAQVFRLFGLARTGKMTLAREVADMVPGKVAFVAFAGKAAMALRAHGCLSATTIHSLIYNVVPDVTGKVHFILKCGKQAPQCALIIVDECSTVDADVAKDLLSCQIPVLTLGDPFQLPSIDGIEFFMNAKPDATLTEVLRQEKNSPILELAARVRQNLNLKCGRYGDSEIPAPLAAKHRPSPPSQSNPGRHQRAAPPGQSRNAESPCPSTPELRRSPVRERPPDRQVPAGGQAAARAARHRERAGSRRLPAPARAARAIFQ